MFPGDLGDGLATVLLFKDRYNLRFAKSSCFHFPFQLPVKFRFFTLFFTGSLSGVHDNRMSPPRFSAFASAEKSG